MLTHKPLSGLLVLTPHEKGGFQMRFVLPAMPALAILAAEAATTTTITLLATSATVAKPASRPTAALAVAGLAVGVTHCLYYGVLFAPLFAELGGSGLKVKLLPACVLLPLPPLPQLLSRPDYHINSHSQSTFGKWPLQ